MGKSIENQLFICKGLPDFKKFTPERIQDEFPSVLEYLDRNYNEIEVLFENLIQEKYFNWEEIMNPLNKLNADLSWSWGVISHLNAVNNSESLRNAYSNLLPKVIKLGNKIKI